MPLQVGGTVWLKCHIFYASIDVFVVRMDDAVNLPCRNFASTSQNRSVKSALFGANPYLDHWRVGG